MFDKELPKYKDRLDAIFPQLPFQTVNVNMTFNHVFNNVTIVLYTSHSLLIQNQFIP
jgi:hypothetical protein